MSGSDIDTRSDVYSFGVLAYELLTGSTPFHTERLVKAGLAEIGRTIKEEDPPTPGRRLSTLGERLTRVAIQHGTDAGRIGKLIAGELDWIVMRAMEIDRRRRYETVDDLITDLNRRLAGEPVLAAPPSWAYRARKFSRKYRRGLAAAAVAGLMLLAGLAGTTWQRRLARRYAVEAIAQKQEADHQKTTAEQKQPDAIVEFIRSDVFVGATPEKMPDKTVRDESILRMLDPAAQAVHAKFKDEPETGGGRDDPHRRVLQHGRPPGRGRVDAAGRARGSPPTPRRRPSRHDRIDRAVRQHAPVPSLCADQPEYHGVVADPVWRPHECDSDTGRHDADGRLRLGRSR